MRDYDAELARLDAKRNEIRRAKALTQRRKDEKVGKEIRGLFPNLPDDPSMMRSFFEELGALARKAVQPTEKVTELDAGKDFDTPVSETSCSVKAGVEGAQHPSGSDLLEQ